MNGRSAGEGCYGVSQWGEQCMGSVPFEPVSPAVPTYKDRRGLLIACGVVQALLGLLLLLMGLMMAFIPLDAMKASQSNPLARPGMRVVIASMYVVPAVIFLTLGIGSARAKNWARIGTLILSWGWLALGVLNLAVVILVLPTVMQPSAGAPAPATSNTLAVVITSVFLAAFFIVLPGIFLLVYHSKNVRATCQGGQLASVPSGPIIPKVLAIWMALGAASIYFCLRYPAVLFGVLVGGIWGKVIYIATALIYAWAAYGIWKLDRRAWRATLWLQIVWTASGIITFTSHEVVQLYREMGMSAQDLAYFERLSHPMAWVMAACVLPAVVFMALLVYARKYFT
jgi:hypothetical protein